MADGRKFLLDTDYPIDKIIGYNEGSFTYSQSQIDPHKVKHGFDFAPLYIIKWSKNSNFHVSYDETGIITYPEDQALVHADSTNINISIVKNKSGTDTYYYRLYYFLPTDEDEKLSVQNLNKNDFVFNTDFNYTKIYKQGTKGSGSSYTINHNLGYYPQVEVWYETSVGLFHKVYGPGSSSPFQSTAVITTSQLKLKKNSDPVTKWYYKIYVDEV